MLNFSTFKRLTAALLVVQLFCLCPAPVDAWVRHVAQTPTGGVVKVLVLFGESNAEGQQTNPEALSYISDPYVQTYVGGSWKPYVPNVNVGYSPVAGQTGYRYFNATTGHWAEELQYLVNERSLHSDRPAFVFKYGVSGSYCGFYTGMDPYLSWDDPDGGHIWGDASSRLTTALAALVSQGYTPVVETVIIMEGGNDQSRSDTYTTFAATLASLISRVQSQAWYTGSTKIILNRLSTAVSGTGPDTVRAATVAAANGTSILWVDTDAMSRNAANDPHYNSAGQLALGQADWNIVH